MCVRAARGLLSCSCHFAVTLGRPSQAPVTLTRSRVRKVHFSAKDLKSIQLAFPCCPDVAGEICLSGRSWCEDGRKCFHPGERESVTAGRDEE